MGRFPAMLSHDFWSVAAIVGFIFTGFAGHHAWLELSKPQVCDTTYIYEGYKTLDLPSDLASAYPRYKLISWDDGDPALRSDAAVLRSSGAPVPLLFVHGHLGTHQQMRSMAAETSREAARRLRAGADHPTWVQWYAVDFNSEPSALEPRLKREQAAFVAACLRHLHGAGRRMVVVGYSMGGVVLQDALSQLGRDSSFDVGQIVVAVVTLGTPNHHLPSFMPPHPPKLSWPSYGKLAGSGAASGADKAAATSGGSRAQTPQARDLESGGLQEVPMLHVLAGPGDFMVPALSAWRHAKGTARHAEQLLLRRRWVRVDLEDVPGAWCTTNHKALVSCNQLVRRLVPALVDVATESKRTAAGADGVLCLLRRRMATHAAAALPATVAEAEVALRLSCAEPAASAAAKAELSAESGEVRAGLLSEVELLSGLGRGVRWEAGQHGVLSSSLVLVVAGAQPGRHFRVTGRAASGKATDLTPLATPLPPLLPSLTGHHAPRHWKVVMDGIDWMRNATWLLQIPLGTHPECYQSVDLALAQGADTAPDAALLAQVQLASASAEPLAVLFGPGSAPIWLVQGHAILQQLQLPGWHLNDGRAAVAVRLAIGAHPPWRLAVKQTECRINGARGQAFLPLLLALSDSAEDSDVARGGEAGLSLWAPGVAGRRVLLLSDPRCTVQLNVHWDLVPWLAYTLRYHGLSIAPVALALCMLRLGSSVHPALPLLAIVQGAAAGTVWPAVTARLSGLTPWLPLTAVDAAVLVLAAGALVAAVNAAAELWVHAVRRVVGALRPTWGGRGSTAAAVAAAAALSTSAAHPAFPALAGICLLTSSLASSAASDAAAADWLLVHVISSVPAVTLLYGWAASGRVYGCPVWSVERGLLALSGLHACKVAWRAGAGVSPFGLRRPSSVVCSVLAAVTALCGLWGHLHVMVYTTAALQVWDLVGLLRDRGQRTAAERALLVK